MARRRKTSKGRTKRPAVGRPARSRRVPRVAGAAVAIAFAAALGYLGVTQVGIRLATARLPALPDLTSHPTVVREHLRNADAEARMDPTEPDAVGALCLAYHADLFYAHAEACYWTVEELDPADWRWPYYRALAFGERGGEAELVAGMRQVIQTASDYGPAWWRLGEAAFKEGRYAEAREAWNRAASWKESDLEALPTGNPNWPAVRSGDAPTRSIPIPLSAYAHVGLARVALLQGELDEARELLELVTREAPRSGRAFRLLAEVYTRLERPTDAVDALRRANRLPPYLPYVDPFVDVLASESRNSTFLLQQYEAAQVARDPAWGEFLVRRALAFDPENPDVVLSVGQLLRGTGQLDEALAMFQRRRQMVPEDPQALVQISGALIDLGRLDEAESMLRDALLELDDAETHYNLGVVLSGRGRLPDAVTAFETAIARDGTHANARNNLVVALIRLGDLAAAEAELDRMLALDPEDDRARTNLGLVYVDRGQLDRAEDQFREALRINPTQPQAQQALRAISR